MKIKAKATIIILSILLLSSIVYNIKILSVLPNNIIILQKNVPDEETTKGIAKIIYRVYTNMEFDYDDFLCVDNNEEWQVHLKRSDDFFGIDDSGVFINKYTGTIRFVSIDERDVKEYMERTQ